MQEAIAKIETANSDATGISYSITNLTWLNGSEARGRTKHGPLMLGLRNRKDANTAINQGLTFDGAFCLVSIYIPRAPQCFRCQDWGHRATECTGEARCGKCAGNHKTSQHHCNHDNPCEPGSRCPTDSHRCANCGGDHAS
ncbi:hypothetical protein M422DRAFT_183936 [Sphaerobolus stellatus SS14]|uniref:CCHC-type domain-containing protein n=1 Tax=Sphaerobolus stellatus (strain SS14) TaxID=990650 RepID=A0A0C9UUL2_SPHS4|nr:hypothetical protein M422DRAFT_183936 [Sphaerobolus stellatus SS14]